MNKKYLLFIIIFILLLTSCSSSQDFEFELRQMSLESSLERSEASLKNNDALIKSYYDYLEIYDDIESIAIEETYDSVLTSLKSFQSRISPELSKMLRKTAKYPASIIDMFTDSDEALLNKNSKISFAHEWNPNPDYGNLMFTGNIFFTASASDTDDMKYDFVVVTGYWTDYDHHITGFVIPKAQRCSPDLLTMYMNDASERDCYQIMMPEPVYDETAFFMVIAIHRDTGELYFSAPRCPAEFRDI